MENQNKHIPYSTTKDQLVLMYVDQIQEKTIIKQINEILKDKGYSVRVKKVPHLEFMEYIDTYGLPRGYTLNNTIKK